MRVGIAIDRWKLPIFNKHLAAAGLKHSSGPGVTDDTMMLYVIIAPANKDTVVQLVKEANAECASSKPNLN